jgi:hypothetical protein
MSLKKENYFSATETILGEGNPNPETNTER